MIDLEHAGRVALNTGLLAWQRDIMDPTRKAWLDPLFAEDRAFIDACIRGSDGLGWSSCSPLVKAYRWDGDYEWCGAFAAYCWHASIPLAVRKRYFPSTYRLDRYGQHKRAFAEAVPVVPLSMRRKYLAIVGEADAALRGEVDVDHFGPRAGDILIVNGRGYGQHITIVEDWNPITCEFRTVEGNATGEGPDGQRHQGVVRQTRPLSVCRRLIRPGLCDITGV